MRHTKRSLSLLLVVLMLATTLFTSACNGFQLPGSTTATEGETTPTQTTPENTTPEATTPEATTPTPTEPVTPPSVFDGIEFSDAAVVIPQA